MSGSENENENKNEGEGEDYWITDEGIDERIGMLADEVTFGTFNEAVTIEGKKMGYDVYILKGIWDNRTCDWCSGSQGKQYRIGQFMPRIPHHPNCRCYWDIYEMYYKAR